MSSTVLVREGRDGLRAVTGKVHDLVDVLETDRLVGDPDDRPFPVPGEHLGGQLLGRGVVEMGRRLVEDEYPLVGQQ